MAVLVLPVLEEIVFRGFLQGWIARATRRAWRGISLANLLTSVCFAAAHLLTQAMLWAALVFFPSMIFGYFRERHEGLGTPILLHAFYNAGAIWVLWQF